MQSVITNLRATGAGLDNINGDVVKLISPLIAPVLSHIFNLVFKTGVFPQHFKEAKVLPVFKKGDCKLVDNYRPISVLPFLDKVLEKVIEIRLSKYLAKFHILSDSQFGFREGLSTNIAIANFTDRIKRCIDNGIYAGTIFVDFARAFDSIDHNILLIKLERYGITGPALNLLRSFLSNRKQRISINGANSDPITVKCGVPQGSILGPILFLIFINDLPQCLSSSQCILYADDTTIISSHTKLDNLMSDLQTDLNCLNNWSSINKLKINVKKTCFMLFTCPQKQTSIPRSLYIQSQEIKTNSSTTFFRCCY